jgi:hypothetical protein
MRDIRWLSPYLKGREFDADTTHAMGQAFDAVMRALPDTGQYGLVRELVAKHIINIVERGERDPRIIEQCTLEYFGFAAQR